MLRDPLCAYNSCHMLAWAAQRKPRLAFVLTALLGTSIVVLSVGQLRYFGLRRRLDWLKPNQMT